MWPEDEVGEEEEDDSNDNDDDDDEDDDDDNEEGEKGEVSGKEHNKEEEEEARETPTGNTQTAGGLSESKTDTRQNDQPEVAVADSGGNTPAVQAPDDPQQQAAPEEELCNEQPEELPEVPEDIFNEYCDTLVMPEPSDSSPPESIGDYELNQIPHFIAILAFN